MATESMGFLHAVLYVSTTLCTLQVSAMSYNPCLLILQAIGTSMSLAANKLLILVLFELKRYRANIIEHGKCGQHDTIENPYTNLGSSSTVQHTNHT
jgi:hypothetical protein